jgi:hypothetical protein
MWVLWLKSAVTNTEVSYLSSYKVLWLNPYKPSAFIFATHSRNSTQINISSTQWPNPVFSLGTDIRCKVKGKIHNNMTNKLQLQNIICFIYAQTIHSIS